MPQREEKQAGGRRGKAPDGYAHSPRHGNRDRLPLPRARQAVACDTNAGAPSWLRVPCVTGRCATTVCGIHPAVVRTRAIGIAETRIPSPYAVGWDCGHDTRHHKTQPWSFRRGLSSVVLGPAGCMRQIACLRRRAKERSSASSTPWTHRGHRTWSGLQGRNDTRRPRVGMLRVGFGQATVRPDLRSPAGPVATCDLRVHPSIHRHIPVGCKAQSRVPHLA